MGWDNPNVPWSELERKLSGRRRPNTVPADADGGDSPAWSAHRPAYDPTPADRPKPPTGPTVPYAELHCHSNYSFLDGGSHPEELVEQAVRLGLHGLALTDHDGLYGAVRMFEAAAEYRLPTVFGAELSLGLSAPQNGMADPEGSHLLVLAEGTEGYHRLAGAITAAHHLGADGTSVAEKGKPVYDIEDLAARAAGHWLVLTGCRKGTVRQALENGGSAADRELRRLVDLFGRDHVAVELTDHGDPLDTDRNDVLAELAVTHRLPVVATNNVHVHEPSRRLLAGSLAAVRARRSMDELDGWLPANGAPFLRSGAEMAARFARYPGAVARSVDFARQLAFSLRLAKPNLPVQQVPWGYNPMTLLRERVYRGAQEKYGLPHQRPDAYARLDRELKVIAEKDFPGYFLIVHDIVCFAREQKILCQGRGSAASSAVCYVLGITAIDAVFYDLPFERFLATTRDEEPDIDVDFDSERREEVIQYVYRKYGRQNAAQVANVITYRPRSAVRDIAKALGYSTGQQDAWAKQVNAWGALRESTDHDIPEQVVDLASTLLTFPRHLGIHSGGMVLTDRPVGEVCPIEWARKANRSVLQWDKDDCAAMGLVKFDLLGLGMLAALSTVFELVGEYLDDGEIDLDGIPKEEPAVYDMLCLADTVGVFQVESRAQMATLPRLRPREFYELAIEVALIRPGPIQGGAVHPYIRRKLGEEKVTYLHDKLEPVLKRTLGIPLFQEQLMQIAVVVGGCSGDDADQLRRAMGSKRGVAKISALREKLYTGMAENEITGDVADEIYEKIEAFANFGFAESHAISFALLVYASAWLRLHYPAIFLVGLLRAQPMGFYSSQTLVSDTQRHGVTVERPDILLSGAQAGLEPLPGQPIGKLAPTGMRGCRDTKESPREEFDSDANFDFPAHRRDGRYAVRLGLAEIRAIGTETAEQIVEERKNGPYASIADLARRVMLTTAQVEALATAGAFDSMGMSRREALWRAGGAARERPDHLISPQDADAPIPELPDMAPAEQTMADLWATGLSTDGYPTRHIRDQLTELGVVPADQLSTVEHQRNVLVGGVVTHRQRPATANQVTFLNLEDETGMVNIICPARVWARNRKVAQNASALLVYGTVERVQGVTNILAKRIRLLRMTVRSMSRDFR